MARHPDYSDTPHIDPGDPPMGYSERTEMHKVSVSHNHPFDRTCTDDCPAWPLRDVKLADIPKANPDPINAWQPGSVEEQRRSGTHFRPEGGSSLGAVNPHICKTHVTQAEMGRMPENASAAEPDGPNYADDEEDVPVLRINVGIPTRERTMRIIRGPAHEALHHFMRMQQAYQDTDQALGAQGQFSEIYHDTAKLKRMIWDRRNPQSVTVDEVTETLKSLIGHALLAMDLIQEGNKDGRA